MPIGTGVSQGVGLAQAMLWHGPVNSDYVPRKSSDPESERRRFDEAVEAMLEKTEMMRQKTARHVGEDEAAIFDAYALMLKDHEALINPIYEIILTRSLTAEYAVNLQFSELTHKFMSIKNEYLQQRAEDVLALREQILRELMGIPSVDANHLDRPTIVVATALSPADLANLDMSRLEGIVCETGGYSSHMAIIARTLGIPTIVGAAGVLEQVEDGQLIAIDGSTGEIWVSPDEFEIEFLRRRADAVAEKRLAAQTFRGRPTISTDGRRVELSANIGQLTELDAALAADAESLGLFRTEFLHVSSRPMPMEEEQFEIYRELLRRLNGKAATVRTFDDGGRRSAYALKSREEVNPALGYRGIRMSLGRPSFFRSQLRALLRASAYGSLKVMFPMISNLDELTEALAALESIKNELRREQTPFDEKMPVGILIGVPSSALLADAMAQKVDFFSISINELIQFTLAIDRGSPDLAYLYNQYNPAILRLIQSTVNSAHAHNIPCNICGDTPGHELMLPLLLGLGLDGFSVNPGLILSTRQVLNNLSHADCATLAEEILQLSSTTEIAKRLLAFG